MSMASSLADGNETLQPPARNPHGFTLSGGSIPGDSFFFEHTMDVDPKDKLAFRLFDDSDDDVVKPAAPHSNVVRMARRAEEDMLTDAFKFELISTKENLNAFFSELVESAASFPSNGPHMAIDDVLPKCINGYEKIVKADPKMGMKGHRTQYEILRRIFLNGGPLSGAADNHLLAGRLAAFFANLDRLSENMFELVRDLSDGWNKELYSSGQEKSNVYLVDKEAFPTARFQDWMPTQPVFIASVLERGGDVSAYRNQVLRAASKSTTTVDDTLVKEMENKRSRDTKTGRLSGKAKMLSSASRDPRRAYPVLGKIHVSSFIEHEALFKACAESLKGEHDLTTEEQAQVTRILDGNTRRDGTPATVEDLASQFEFDLKLRSSIEQFGELVKMFKEGGKYLIEEGLYREAVFVLTSLQNNQSVHVSSNNKSVTWALKLLHEILRLHDPRLKDKRFEKTEDKPEPCDLRSCKRQRTHCEPAEVPHKRASVMIIYLIAERMSCLYRIRHRAFEASDMIDEEWDISHAKCDAHLKDANAKSCRGGVCTARKSDELKKLLGIHKSDVTSAPEYFQGARTTSKFASSSSDCTVAMIGPSEDIRHGSAQAMQRLEEACEILERIVNGVERNDDDCVENLFGSDNDLEDEDDGQAKPCTTIQIEGGNEMEVEQDEEDEEEGEAPLEWLRTDTRKKHTALLEEIDTRYKEVLGAISFAEDCIELQKTVAEETHKNMMELNNSATASNGTELEMKKLAFNTACMTIISSTQCEYKTSADLQRIVGEPERWKWDQEDRRNRLKTLRNAQKALKTYKEIVTDHNVKSSELKEFGFFNFFVKSGPFFDSICLLKSNRSGECIDFDIKPKDTGSVPLDWFSRRLTMYQTQSSEFSTNIINAVRNAFLFCCNGVKIYVPDSLALPNKSLEFNGVGISCILTMLSIAHHLGFVKMLSGHQCITRDFTTSDELFAFAIYEGSNICDRRIAVASLEKLHKIAMSGNNGWKLICMLTEVARFVSYINRKGEYDSQTTFDNMRGDKAWLTLSRNSPFAKIHEERKASFLDMFSDISGSVQSSYPSRYSWSFADACEIRNKQQFKTIATWVPAFLNNKSGFIDITGARYRPSKREDALVDIKRTDEIDSIPHQYFEQFYEHAQFGDTKQDYALDLAHSPDASLPETCKSRAPVSPIWNA